MRSVVQTVSRVSDGPIPARWPVSRVSPVPQQVPKPIPADAAYDARPGHDFSGVSVSSAPPGRLQARLVVGRPGDFLEREADRVADQVLGFPGKGEAARAGAVGVSGPNAAGADSVRRAPLDSEGSPQVGEEPAMQADEGEAAGPEGVEETARGAEQVAVMLLEQDDLENDEGNQGAAGAGRGTGAEQTVQAREIPGRTPTVSPRQEAAVSALRGGGHPLPASSRTFFQQRFGHDFSGVRVHTGPDAGRMARSFDARAFTVGRDVVFGTGQYEPATRAGKWLIAHELTHVLQQREGVRRASAGGIQVQQAGGDRVQGGFFGDVWSGIKKAAGAVASAAKWVGGKVWTGIKAVGKWGWNVIKSGAALAWNQVVKFPGRVWRLIKHLGSGVAGLASWLWQGLKLAVKLDFKGLGNWLLDGIVSGAAWVGRLIGKLVDIAGLGEVWDLLFQIIKFNTRPLTSGEKSEAHRVFKDSIAYWQVRVDEYSLIAAIGAAFKGGGGMGVTTFHTINFNQKLTAAPGSSDQRWLTHELTHVSQYEHVGSQYLGEAIHAQVTTGYDYKGPSALWRPSTHASPNTLGKHFNQFSREQQGDIAADYYWSLYHNTQPEYGFLLVTTDYEPVVDELRSGDL